MAWVATSLRHAPSAATSEEEIEALSRRAWKRKWFSVSLEDARLTWADLEYLNQLGTRLHGPQQ